MREDEPDPQDGKFMTIRWSHAALGAVIVAIGSLGALAIVASVKQADTLATVALALAILAFVIQIIIFVAQAATSSSEHRESQRINADTSRLLAELRTHAVDTNQLVSKQFDKLLDRFVLAAKSEGDSASPEGDESRREILAQLSATAENLRRNTAVPSSGIAESSRIEEEPSSRAIRAQQWLRMAMRGPGPMTQRRLIPDEEVRNLPPKAVAELGRFAADLVFSLDAHIPDGLAPGADDEGSGILRRLGLLKAATDDELNSSLDDDGQHQVLLRLTPKGRAVSSLITARRLPADTLEGFPWLEKARKRWQENEAQYRGASTERP